MAKLKDILSGKKSSSSEEIKNTKYGLTKNSVSGFDENTIYDVPISDIDLDNHEFQMRIGELDITELKESISSEGQKTPVVLLKRKEEDMLIILSGFNRTIVLKELGSITVKAIIKNDLDNVTALSIGFIENEARKNLTDWEKIQGIVKMSKEGKSLRDIAKMIGKDHATISIYIKINDSKEIIKNALRDRLIDFSKSLVLCKYQDKLSDGRLNSLIKESKDFSYRKYEELVNEVLLSKKSIKEIAVEEKKKPARKRIIKDKKGFFIELEKCRRGYKIKCAKQITEKNVKEAIEQIQNIINELKAINK